MEKTSVPHQFIPENFAGLVFSDFMLPTDSSVVRRLCTTAKYLSPQPGALLEESIVKLFKVAFDIDIKTCTKEEWAERITMEGGALEQWQSFIK
ncbi:MAG TPA: hypothetical protein VFC58_14540 [Desulfosporosinus sp.]|nr:hypothetical protein [Desulfosporosinus sp.]